MDQNRLRIVPTLVASLGLLTSALMTTGCGSSSSSQRLTSNTVTDVYVAGWQNTSAAGNDFVATYWKNGNAVLLSQLPSTANSIAVSGNDVYVAGSVEGSQHGIAVYWKNGTQIDLTDGSSEASANSIFVQGTDVYVTGNVLGSNSSAATYWKNGVPVVLDPNAYVQNIVVSGTDVYVAGSKSKPVRIDANHYV
jgi:hypothetical protein